MAMPFRRVLLICMSALIWATGHAAQPRAEPPDPGFYSESAADYATPPGTLLRYEPLKLPGFFRARAWRILYNTRDYRDRPIASSGIVIVSDYAPADQARRHIVAWAHPTTGIASKCAPSLHPSPADSVLGLAQLISDGYIVAATDYPGLGTGGPMGYLVGRGQAFAVIDSVRAARQIPGVGGSTSYALLGYSQGGHAVLAAENWSKSYAAELSLVGVAAIAPPTDLKALLTKIYESKEGRVLTALTLASWSTKYGVPLDEIVPALAAPAISSIAGNCVDNLPGRLEDLSAERPLPDEYLNKDALERLPWSELMTENSILGVSGTVPLFVSQGERDTIVLPDVTDRFVQSACRTGAPVRYMRLPATGHGVSAGAAKDTAISWIKDRFSGVKAPSDCP